MMRGRLGRRARQALAIALSGLAATACVETSSAREAGGEVVNGEWRPVAADVKEIPLAEVRRAVRARLDEGARPEGIRDQSWRRIDALYAAYEDIPLWHERDGLTQRAQALLQALREAHQDAIDLQAYPLAELHEALAVVEDERRPSAQQLSEAELLLTAVYVSLAEDLLTGQVDPDEVTQAWHIDPQQADVDSALVRAFRQPELAQSLGALRPQNDDYALLRQELARYRELVAAGGWSEVPGGETLNPGEQAPASRLQALAARLRAEGYLNGDAAVGTTYDRRLAGAVAAFQARHAIVVDSILGGETLESLNLPADYRLGQIAANLERHRWLPRSLGSRYVLVNVPAFRLEAYENGEPALSMRVVVGAEYDQRSTPAFADSMSYVVFRPYWNVPQNIAENEIWPQARQDPGYLARRNYEVVEEYGDTRIRQTPGDHNALGLVKFMFPNDFAIYLHDTPEDALFQEDVRAFSHGCIRVENPEQLANFVLGWDRARIEQAMYRGQNDQQVGLDRKLPVFIVYFTTYGRDGQLYFGNDLYGRDDALVRRVADAARSSGETERALAELRELVD